MRFTGYGDFDWEGSGYWAAVPAGWVPTVQVQPNVLYRAGTTATFGPSQIGEMTIPVEFGYRGSLTYEQAWANLVRKLQPANPLPRELRGVRNDGVVVRTRAVLVFPGQGGGEEVNTLTASFVAVDPYWLSLQQSTAVATVGGSAVTFNVPVTGDLRVIPAVRVQPTAQRSSKVANVGWQWRRRYTITNGSAQTLVNYPYAIDLGSTTALVSGTPSKALSSGNDVRVVLDGAEVARTLVGWNTSSTSCWVVIPSLAAGASLTYDVLYGNASAGAPPTLAYPLLPAFDLATSTNSKWVYLTARTAANAGKGGWYLSAGSSQPGVFDQTVPGAWQSLRTLTNGDAATQDTSTSYVDTATYWQARFQASRGRSAAIANPNNTDGVAITVPTGITSVRAELRWTNPESGATGSSPVGRLVILTRASASADWVQLYSNTTTQATEATIAAATYTPAATVPTVAFAVWPFNASAVDNAARSDRVAVGAWGGTLELNVGGSAVTQALTQAETEVYELATEVRQDRSGRSGNVIYTALRLGNQQQRSGAGTPRLTVPLNNVVVVDGTKRTPQVWDSAVSTLVETLAPGTVAAWDGVPSGTGTTEQAAQEWLPLTPGAVDVTNGSFTDATPLSWAAVQGVSGFTSTRDTTTFSTSPAAYRIDVAAGTGAAGRKWGIRKTDDVIVASGRGRIWVVATVRSSNANIQPTFAFRFDGATDPVVETDWVVTANTWVRRAFAVTVPTNAATAVFEFWVTTKATSPTGSVWIDDITINDTDLTLSDVSGGTVSATVVWTPRYA